MRAVDLDYVAIELRNYRKVEKGVGQVGDWGEWCTLLHACFDWEVVEDLALQLAGYGGEGGHGEVWWFREDVVAGKGNDRNPCCVTVVAVGRFITRPYLFDWREVCANHEIRNMCRDFLTICYCDTLSRTLCAS